MPLLSFLETPPSWIPVVDVFAKATLVLIGGALIALSLRRASAASRHLVWVATLVATLALPAAAAVVPGWTLAVMDVTHVVPQVEEQTALHGVAPRAAAGVADDHLTASVFRPEPVPPAAQRSGIRWEVVIASIWAAGTLAVLLYVAAGVLVVHRIARRSESADDAAWFPIARTLADDLGISRVRFGRSSVSAMPMTCGVWRPLVLLPADADSWPQERLRVVLLHELAHVKRGDCLTHLLAQTAGAVYWMNPLTWIALRRTRAERERACDDLVLACGTPGPDYAAALLDVARTMRARRFSSVAAGASLAMAHRTQLEGRLMAILDPSVPRSSISRGRAGAVAVGALLIVAPLASMDPWVRVEAAMIPAVQVVPPPPPPPVPSPAPTPAPDPAPAPLPAPQDTSRPVSPRDIEGITAAAIAGTLEALPETIAAAIDGALAATEAVQQRTTDPKVIAALMEALKDTDREVRESAMHALVRLRHPGSFEPLVEALRDRSASIRESAAFGLGQLRDKRAVDALRAALADDSANVREQVVFALGQLRDRAAFEGLAQAVQDASPGVREQAVFALGQLRDVRAIDPLVEALRDTSAGVREQAAFALGQLRAREAVDALIAALKEPDAEVRERAAFALGQIGDPRAVDALSAALKDASARVRQQVAFALGQLAR